MGKNVTVGAFDTHEQAENAIKELQRSHFDMQKLSIIGKDYRNSIHCYFLIIFIFGIETGRHTGICRFPCHGSLRYFLIIQLVAVNFGGKEMVSEDYRYRQETLQKKNVDLFRFFLAFQGGFTIFETCSLHHRGGLV